LRTVPILVACLALAGLPAAGCAGGPAADADAPKEGDTVIDPVCGQEATVFEGSARGTHEGRTYHFCSASCAEDFQRDPGQYAQR